MMEIINTKNPVTIIGVKYNPGSNGFTLISNLSMVVMIDVLSTEE